MGKSKNKRRSKKNPWITDGYPEMWEQVIVLIEHEGGTQIHTQTFCGKEYWYFGDSKILAWMPIPSYNHMLTTNRI